MRAQSDNNRISHMGVYRFLCVMCYVMNDALLNWMSDTAKDVLKLNGWLNLYENGELIVVANILS